MKEHSLTRLTIENAEFYAYHGVKDAEKKLGGKYQVDIDLYYDATQAIVNDDVRDALNYEEALFCVSDILENERYNLVETIVNEILNQLMEKFMQLERATVRLRKLNVPVQSIISCIECEQSIEREYEDDSE